MVQFVECERVVGASDLRLVAGVDAVCVYACTCVYVVSTSRNIDI